MGAITWYPEKSCDRLRLALDAARIEILFKDGEYTSPTPEAAQALLDAFDVLTAKKADKVAAAKALLAVKIASGFLYAGHIYQIDDDSQNHMVATMADFLQGNADAHGGYWRAANNVNVAMTADECKTFLVAAKAYKMGCIRNTQAKVDAILAAASQAALDAVDLAAGWP